MPSVCVDLMLLGKESPTLRESRTERDLPLPFIANPSACLNKRLAKTGPGSAALCPNVLSISHPNVLVDRLFIDVGATESRTLPLLTG